jgi:hypothetical protein
MKSDPAQPRNAVDDSPARQDNEDRVLETLRDLHKVLPHNPTEITVSDWTAINTHFKEDLEQARQRGLIDVWPIHLPDIQNEMHPDRLLINYKPAALLKITETITVRRQITVDGQRVDIRNARNYAIVTAKLEALISDVKANIHTVLNPTIEFKERRGAKMWLKYELLLRGHELPQELRHDAEQCRDLHFEAPKKTKKSKEAEPASTAK